MIMLKKILPYLLVAIGALIIYHVLFSRYDIKTDIQEYEDAIEALEKKVDSLHSKNSALELEADSLEFKLEESDNKIKQLLINLKEAKVLNEKGIIILHRHRNEIDNLPASFKIIEEKKYGISKIIFGSFY